MENERNKTQKNELSLLLASKGAIDILKQLNAQGEVRWSDFTAPICENFLCSRLRKLERLGLIQYHFIKKGKRRAWYEITEKGKKILEPFEKEVTV